VRLKVVASVLLLLPASALSLVGLAEMASGEPSGAQHLLQAAPLGVGLIAGWFFPRFAGIALLALGALLLTAWLLFIASGQLASNASLLTSMGVGAVLFALPITAGVLFIASGSQGRQSR
jgi:hypothetical protein